MDMRSAYLDTELMLVIRSKEMCIRDSHNGNTYKHGNSYLLWELDKDSIANQSAISLIIRATGICLSLIHISTIKPIIYFILHNMMSYL